MVKLIIHVGVYKNEFNCKVHHELSCCFLFCFHQIFFQVLIILTGNYNFFNLLAIALLLAILDDEHLVTILRSWLGEKTCIHFIKAFQSHQAISLLFSVGVIFFGCQMPLILNTSLAGFKTVHLYVKAII